MGLAESIRDFFQGIIDWFFTADAPITKFMNEQAIPALQKWYDEDQKEYEDNQAKLEKLVTDFTEGQAHPVERTVKTYFHERIQGMIDTIENVAKGQVESAPAGRKAFIENIVDTQLDLYLFGTSIDILSKGAVLSAGKLTDILANSLGYSWQSYIAYTPPIKWGLAGPLERFYAKKYRNLPTTIGTALEFYSKDKIDRDTCDQRLAEQGVSIPDSTTLMDIAFTNIPVRTLRTLHKTFPEIDLKLTDRFKQLRYNPSDFDLLTKYIESTEDVQTKELSITTAGKAYNKGLRTDSWFREFLKTQGFNDDSISLYVDLYKSEELDTERTIMKSDVVSALKAGKIDEAKARQWLGDLRYTTEAINLLISLATTTKNAELRDASISVYENLYINNRLDENAYRDKLKSLGVSESGIDAYIDRDNLKKIEKPNLLSQSDILSAYSKGLKDGQWTSDYLKLLGYSLDDVDVLLELHAPKAA